MSRVIELLEQIAKNTASGIRQLVGSQEPDQWEAARSHDLRAIAEARELRCLDLGKTLAEREEQVAQLHRASTRLAGDNQHWQQIVDQHEDTITELKLTKTACHKQIMADTRERNDLNSQVTQQARRIEILSRKLNIAVDMLTDEQVTDLLEASQEN